MNNDFIDDLKVKVMDYNDTLKKEFTPITKEEFKQLLSKLKSVEHIDKNYMNNYIMFMKTMKRTLKLSDGFKIVVKYLIDVDANKIDEDRLDELDRIFLKRITIINGL